MINAMLLRNQFLLAIVFATSISSVHNTQALSGTEKTLAGISLLALLHLTCKEQANPDHIPPQAFFSQFKSDIPQLGAQGFMQKFAYIWSEYIVGFNGTNKNEPSYGILGTIWPAFCKYADALAVLSKTKKCYGYLELKELVQ